MVGVSSIVGIGDRTKEYDITFLPFPTHFVGNINLWDNAKHIKCPDCGGRRLVNNTYCLRCDSWSYDYLLDGNKNSNIIVKITNHPQKQAKIRYGIPLKHSEQRENY